MTDEKTTQKLGEQSGEQPHKGFVLPPVGASRKLNLKRARFIALIKDRYGYTNERAIVEMERLLREFSASNASLHIKQARRDFETPLLE